ncbi:MAG: UbiD family decarboxylase [Chloroflexi bacterium]|nr:UbiD family decarboxylase [Chloroflexota bacterium]
MNQIDDLRTFMSVLETAVQLIKIQRPVSLIHELANVAAACQRQGRGAILFEHPQDAAWPVFAGAVGSPTLAALALGCDVAQITETMGRALEPANGIPTRRVPEAGWQQNVLTGDDVDLRRLPIPTHGRHDGGPFITGGITITKDPVSGRGNLSYNRMQVLGPRTFGFNVNEWRHVMQFYRVQEAKGEPLEITIAIGVDPAISIAAGARYDDDELLIAGAIRGEGVPVCKGITVDIDVPANAEIVIEGHLPPGERRKEGPLLLRFVRHVSPNVTGLHIPPYGNGFAAIVQVAKSNPGEPRNIALAAFTAHVNIKKVIVVDPDVNIYDPADVLWALTNRVDWSRDTFTVPGAQGHEMDPTANERGIHTKIGIDATYKPDRRDYGERIRYPEVDLSEYLEN